MCGAISIAIEKKHMKDEVIDYILNMDSLGQISLDSKPQRLIGETWAEALERTNSFTSDVITSNTADAFGLDTKVEDSRTYYMSGDSQIDEIQMADELSHLKAQLRIWFESCDGYNPYELLMFDDGDHVVYDVDYDDSVSYVRAEAISLIRNYPAQEFKTVVLDLLQSTRYNDKADYQQPFGTVIPKHKIAGVLGRLDEGEIEADEAMSLIKEINKPVINEYMVFIQADYCDGQAYINTPDGEFGGDGYVELSSTYPMCIGTYRGESPEQAIGYAASDMEASEEILFAVQIQN